MDNRVSDNWYETFFSGINCEMWAKAMTAEWTEKEVAFILDVLQVKPGDHLLDIPCGTGRHSVSLAKKGFHVTSVDISKEFITGLRQKVAEERLAINVIEGNILSLELAGSFDGAFCFGNSFGYFNRDGMRNFVTKVAASLKPGGWFIINSGMMAESILPDIPPDKAFVIGDLTMNVKNEYVLSDSYLRSHLTYTRSTQSGFSETHSFKHYVYTMGEIKSLVESVGLNIRYRYNSMDKIPYAVGDAQVYLIAEKVN